MDLLSKVLRFGRIRIYGFSTDSPSGTFINFRYEIMKERIKELGYWVEDKVKDLCGEITPDKRLTVILIMLLLFTILNLYFTFTSISDWGREQERKDQLKIEHIRQLELERTKSNEWDSEFIDSDIDTSFLDSINNNKINEPYG